MNFKISFYKKYSTLISSFTRRGENTRSGILMDKTMYDKLIYNPNNDKQCCRSKLRLKSLDTYSFDATNQKSITVPIVFEPTNNITLLKVFRYQCNLQSNVPSIPDNY